MVFDQILIDRHSVAPIGQLGFDEGAEWLGAAARHRRVGGHSPRVLHFANDQGLRIPWQRRSRCHPWRARGAPILGVRF